MTLLQQLHAARRELSMRQRVYPGLIQRGKLTEARANHELEAQAAIVATFEGMVNRPVAVQDVLAERGQQDARWGVQNHDPQTWLSILMEEVGEFSQEILRSTFSKTRPVAGTAMATDNLRIEAVQTAAVALAIVECVDRGEWRWPVPFARVEEKVAA